MTDHNPLMRRLAPIALLALTLTACGGGGEQSEQAAPEPTSSATPTPPAISAAPEPTSARDACTAVKHMPGDFAPASRWSDAFDELSALSENASLEASGVLLPFMEAALAYAKDPAPGQDSADAFDLYTKAKEEYVARCR